MLLRALILVAPIAVALVASTIAARVAPPDELGVNRWLWMVVVFVGVSLLLAVMRRALRRLTPLAALMELTLVFPDQAPSRSRAVLRRSSSRSMLRQIEEARARGERTEETLNGEYLVQLLTEINEHDRLTRGHSERVRSYAEMLGEELGLSEGDLNRLRWAALLHDVGKLDVPAEILNKDGRPTEDEWAILSNHPAAAMRMLEPLRPWLGQWVHAADQHHCRWDGGGYPVDLAGEDISLAGRIVAVADAYDVMTSARSYKKPLSTGVARQELTNCAGSQFDPAMVRAFLNVSLGRLHSVAGPFAGLINLATSSRLQIPLASSVPGAAGSAVTAVSAVVVTAVGGLGAEAPPPALALVEEPPPAVVATALAAAGPEDEAIDLILVADGGDGLLSFELESPDHGRVVATPPEPTPVAGGEGWELRARYTPAPDVNGIDSFRFEACDAGGRCDRARVTITVDPVNDAPRAVEDRATVSEGRSTSIDVLANDVDVDGDPLRIVDVRDTGQGLAIEAEGRLLYVPQPGQRGPDRILYTVADPAGARSTGEVVLDVVSEAEAETETEIQPPSPTTTSPPPTTAPPITTTTVLPVVPDPNTAPSPEAAAASTDEDVVVIVDVWTTAVDADGDPLTLVAVGAADHGTVLIDDGGVRYQPDVDHHGTDAFVYAVSDGIAPAVGAIVTVTIDPVNDAPAASAPATAVVAETVAVGAEVVSVSAADADGDDLTFAIVAGDPTDRFAIDGAGRMTVLAPLDHETTALHPIEVTVTDGVETVSLDIAVTVADVNEAPVASDDAGPGFGTDEDVALTTASVLANDSDVDDPVDPASIDVVSNPTNGTLVDNGDGTFRYDPDPGWSGTDGFVYTITDAGSLTSAPATVTLTVAAVNDAPDVTDPGAQSGAEETPFVLQISATDPEGDGLSYGAVGLPTGLSIGPTGRIDGTPAAGTAGLHSVQITVTDDGSPPEPTTITVPIDIGYHEVSADAGSIVINEILYETVSVTAPEEFVELHNRSGSPVDLTGWNLADSNLKVDGARDLDYTFPTTDHWGTASTLAAGERAIVWLVHDGANLPPVLNPTSGLEYVASGGTPKLADGGDDVWLIDGDTRIVDYVAYGAGGGVGTGPEAALGLWDATHQASLVTGGPTSIALTPDGSNGDTSACWEATASDAAAGRCPGAQPTYDSDGLGSLTTSVGNDNNRGVANAGGAYAIDEGDAVVLDGTSSTGASSWAWDLDNDGSYDDAFGSNPTVAWATLAAAGVDDDGTYPVGLSIDGGADTDATSLTVANVEPVLSTTGSGTVADGGTYTLNLGVVDPGDDTITGWTINWGDGTIETVVGNPSSVTHPYSGAGRTYDILVSATDDDGTYLQNELLVPSYDGDAVFRYAPTSGAFVDSFAGPDDPIQTLVGPDGLLYVSGDVSNDVRRYDPQTGAVVDTFVASGSGGLSGAEGIVFEPGGDLLVADYGGDRVLRYDGSTGAYNGVFASTSLSGPYGLAYGPDHDLYVGNYDADEIIHFDGSTGAHLGTFVTVGGGGPSTPEGLTFGPDGHLYVASFGSGEVRRYDGSTGTLIDVFVASGGAGDLDQPSGIVFGPDGHLYVADLLDHTVLRYDGSTGAFIDTYVAPGAGGLTQPALMTFLTEHQVTVTP